MSHNINEAEHMLFISTDEGSSFQRQPLNFRVDTLLFHPKEEDKLLAYSKDAKVSQRCALFFSPMSVLNALAEQVVLLSAVSK